MSAEQVLRDALGVNRARVALDTLRRAGYRVVEPAPGGTEHSVLEYHPRYVLSAPRRNVRLDSPFDGHVHSLSTTVTGVGDEFRETRIVEGHVTVSNQILGLHNEETYRGYLTEELRRQFLDELGRHIGLDDLAPLQTPDYVRARAAYEGALLGPMAMNPAVQP